MFNKKHLIISILLLFGISCIIIISRQFHIFNINTTYLTGQKIDSLNGVYVYYNGKMGNVSGRNTVNGYNVGLKYQCVEFVKRYYLEHYNHEMPNSYGHAKDFIQKGLKDGAINTSRNLKQYKNPSKTKPKVGDILVFDGHAFNKFGHIAIISKVSDNQIEIIQQNTGSKTREKIKLVTKNFTWRVDRNSVLGWLRKQ